MSATRITCPQCQAALRLPATLPAGLRPKCPRCGVAIALPGSNGASPHGDHRSKAVSKSHPAAVAANSMATPQAPPPGMVPDHGELPQKRRMNILAVLAIVFGGFFLLLVLSAGLLALCFMGESNEPGPVVQEEPNPKPAAVVKQPPKKKPPAIRSLIELSPENEKKVDEATRRGVKHLKELQIKLEGPNKGSWNSYATLGYTSLAGLTLLECHVPASDPSVQNAAHHVRHNINQQLPGNETYQVSLAILFLSRLEDKSDRELVRSLALRLVASQSAAGGWAYNSPPLTGQQEGDLLTMLENSKTSTGGGISPSLGGRPLGAWQKRNDKDPNFFRGQGDNSNTQFALLALWTARRFDLPLDPVLKLVANRFRRSQNGDGSWAYQDFNIVSQEYPTMTAAGLLGLAVGYGLDNDKKENPNIGQDQVLKKGLERLAKQVGNPGGPTNNPPPLYFLWSVERVAMLFQLAKIDGKDWYPWGMEILLAHQKKNGGWHLNRGHGSSDVVDTCFALLFLQRANLAKDLTDKIEQLMAIMGWVQGKE